ncbi:MAG: hypothetical protein DCC49_04900 [Acidobacteria bacterium]|nr:MAG: hypothetical protein DCC49_04900 [Acidobacteriota bacterium]
MLATRLSPSRASDFKQCPQLYKFRVVDKLPEPPSRAMLQGTIVHHILEKLFELAPDQRTLETAISRIEDAIAAHEEELRSLPEVADSESESDADLVRSQVADFVREMLEAYFVLEDPSLIEPVARELRLHGDLNGASVVGVIDRLEQDFEGAYVVSDYKTGKAPPANYQEKAFFGLRVYAALLEASDDFGAAPKRLRLIYLKSREILEMDIDQGHLRGTKSQMAAISKAIETAIELDNWPPSPGKLCDWCYFKPICPAFQS